MPSKSSSDARPWGLALGRVSGHRGVRGELTVRVRSGEAGRWTGLTRVGMAEAEDGEPVETFSVEASRAYRDRLVLKLSGIDDASAAARRRGRWVRVKRDEEAPLPEGRWYLRDLLAREVRTVDGRSLGVVEDVVETGGVDLLSVRTGQGKELLIPMAPTILLAVGEDGPLEVDLPEGLDALAER